VPYHFALLSALAMTSVAAFSDWRTGKIPDVLTLGALAGAPVAQAALAYLEDTTAIAALYGFAGAILGAAAGGILPFLLLRAGGMSGGDVKLFCALGAITGPAFAIHAVTYAMVAALVQGLVLVARRKSMRSTWCNVRALWRRPVVGRARAEQEPLPAMTTMRLALSTFLGTCVATSVLW
jgi:prepilin peptidase CpaA